MGKINGNRIILKNASCDRTFEGIWNSMASRYFVGEGNDLKKVFTEIICFTSLSEGQHFMSNALSLPNY